jgi:adenylosuccinate lyase
MEKLLIYPQRMLANLESLGGVVHSGEVLLTLTRAGISREDAYRIVQSCAMETWTRLGTPEGRSFRMNLEADPDVARMVKPAELTAAMNPALHLRSVDRIFERVFG